MNNKQKNDRIKRLSGDEEIGMIERSDYSRLKRRAIRFEEKNRKYILVVPCSGNQGWCEMGETSALLYKYQVCLELGIPVELTDDFDSYDIQYEVGRIRTRGFDTVRRRIKKAGLYGRETTRDKCVIFELDRAFSEKELMRIRNEEMRRQMQANMIVKVQFADPILYQMLTEMSMRLHQICCRKLDRLSSATNGETIVEFTDDMVRQYYDMGMLEMSQKERMVVWKKMAECARRLLVEIQLMSGAKLWPRSKCVAIGEKILEIDGRIKWDMEHEAKKSRK